MSERRIAFQSNLVTIYNNGSVGHRFVFPLSPKQHEHGTACCVGQFLRELEIDYKLFQLDMGMLCVIIQDGPYKGFYDAQYDFEHHELNLYESN